VPLFRQAKVDVEIFGNGLLGLPAQRHDVGPKRGPEVNHIGRLVLGGLRRVAKGRFVGPVVGTGLSGNPDSTPRPLAPRAGTGVVFKCCTLGLYAPPRSAFQYPNLD
jgi:hypothetical protein